MKLLVTFLLAVFVQMQTQAAPVEFEWFEYTGRDNVFETPLPAGHYRNPILAGYYPDPSITRAGNKFYLVNSTFAYFPGIPVFESSDLVHWQQLGHAIDRPTQLKYDGLGVSRGVFAPTIEYHDGLFYIFNTHVDGGGNFVITARDPKGPWSDPVWLPDLVDGIDPSMFVDDDGRAYVMNNGPPEGEPLYEGHRAIWIQEFDRERLVTKGPRKVLVNGGIDLRQKPIWIEGPHIYKRDGWYYLNCAEGGTGPQHSQVILRSRSPWGPFAPSTTNPILTQRGLPEDRKDPITNAGHADLVEAPDGSWWAVFLSSRTYADGQYNTGRETFLLPVEWRDGWPSILPPHTPIPYVVRGPKFMKSGDQAPFSGNFTWRDEFDAAALKHAWFHLRTPKEPWWDLKRKPGALSIHAQSGGFAEGGSPSFLARRQQHLTFDASLGMRVPNDRGIGAGLVAFQNEMHWYFIGARHIDSHLEIFVEKRAGSEHTTIARTRVDVQQQVDFKVSGDRGAYSFGYRLPKGEWQILADNQDGTILSTERAGGFVGAVIGPYVRHEVRGDGESE